MRKVLRRKPVRRKRKQRGGSLKDAMKSLAPLGPIIATQAIKRLIPKKKRVKRRRRRPVAS